MLPMNSVQPLHGCKLAAIPFWTRFSLDVHPRPQISIRNGRGRTEREGKKTVSVRRWTDGMVEFNDRKPGGFYPEYRACKILLVHHCNVVISSFRRQSEKRA